MALFERGKAGEIAQDVADHLRLVENVKSLQQGQKEIADAMQRLHERLHALECEMKSLKPEIKLEALKEASSVVWQVQTELNQRVQDIAIKVGVLENKQLTLPPAAISQLSQMDANNVDGHG